MSKQVELHDSDIALMSDACALAKIHYTDLANKTRTTEAQRKEWVLKVKRIAEMEHRLFTEQPPVF